MTAGTSSSRRSPTDCPFFKNAQRLEKNVLGGWEVSGIYRYQSGQPFTVTASTGIGTRRADYLGGDPVHVQCRRRDRRDLPGWTRRSLRRRLKPGSETAAATSSSDRRTRTGHLIRKSFTVDRQTRMQFQADFFNAFNQVIWANPADSMTGSTPFGTITSARRPERADRCSAHLLARSFATNWPFKVWAGASRFTHSRRSS